MPAHKGRAHHLAKLNDDLVREIRQQYEDGKTLECIQHSLLEREPPVQIESCYGTLYPIVKYQTWRHVK